MKNNGRRPFRAGEVVYFHHLHTRPDLVRHDLHRDDAGRSWCQVEGKPRPMLILRPCWRLLVDTARSTGEPSGTNQCVWYRVETQVAYWVLSLQSKAPPGQHEPLRIEVDRGKPSYVVHDPLCYPAESVCHGPNQHVHSVEERLFGMIVKEIGLHKLGLPDDYRA